MKVAETMVFRRSHTARIGGQFLQGPMNVKYGRRAMAGPAARSKDARITS